MKKIINKKEDLVDEMISGYVKSHCDRVKISKSSIAPKIDLITSLAFNKIGSETSFISKQSDQSFFGGINIQIPIFSGNLRRSSIKNAKINLENQELQKNEISLTIERDFNNAWDDYQNKLEITQFSQR